MGERKGVAKTLVVNHEGDVLVLVRSDKDSHARGRVDVPGGGVKKGETHVVAAARELEEEAGIKVSVGALALIRSFTEYDAATGNTLDRALYYTEVSDPAVVLSDEHQESWWDHPSNLLELFAETSWRGSIQYAIEQGLLDPTRAA